MARRDSSTNPENTKICFVICPIGNEGSEERERSDIILEDIIKPVANIKFGYNVVRADEIKQPGTITRQIIENLINSDLVIADLSNGNPNVFYELAVRHATRKPYIQMIDRNQTPPFDVGAVRTIKFNLNIKFAKLAMQELERQIATIESGNFEIDNPVGDTIDLMNLKGKGKIEDYNIAILSKTLSEIQSQIYRLDQTVNYQLKSNYPAKEQTGFKRTDRTKRKILTLSEIRKEIVEMEKFIEHLRSDGANAQKIKDYQLRLIELRKIETNLVDDVLSEFVEGS